jgi:hypothetical protein
VPGNYSRALTFSDFVLGSVETNSESPDAAAGGEVAGGEAAGGDVVGGEVSRGAAVEEEAAGARISVRSFTLNWDDVGGLPSEGGEAFVVAGDREGAHEEGAEVAALASLTLDWDHVGGLPSQGGEEDVVAGDREGAQEEGAVVAVLRARIGELEAALVLCGGGGDVKGREGKEEADAVAVAAGREQERTGREGRESQREREREVRQQVEEMVSGLLGVADVAREAENEVGVDSAVFSPWKTP